MEEVLIAKGQLKVTEATINELEKDSYSRGKKIEARERAVDS